MIPPHMTINLKEVALKWQEKWDKAQVFKTELLKDNKKTFYCLEMFPYPSGYLHMGHVRNYSLGDVCARYKRMSGHNVLYPMGYDSFGLPAENAAIKNKKHPHEWTEHNINGIKKQQKLMGFSYDWDREVAASRVEYYHWNQWIFLQMFKKGMVYKKGGRVNWCPDCNTVLANEQVVNGKCWRHGETEVEQKELEQWYIKITNYADELLKDLDKLTGWPERVKVMQKNWIGRSEGTLIDFKVKALENTKDKEELTLTTFTTRADTAYGITYLVIAAEHPIIETLIKDLPATKQKEVRDFIKETSKRTVIDRTAEGKPKNGVFLGRHAINPLTGNEFPLWVADYALVEYGTGMVMAVPAHDQRDFEFAKKYELPIKAVINPPDFDLNTEKMSRAFVDDGVMINSGEFDGTQNRDGIKAVTKKLETLKAGEATINYKLRDWLVSRQRYWGTPIPIIYCDKCGTQAAPQDELPILLPENPDFSVGGNPIASVESFVNCACPSCGGNARRETDTMDTFFDSSWYYFRFCDPHNTKRPFDKAIADSFMPVNQYIGGIEHAVLHLLYARFFTKFLRDCGLTSISEPFEKLLTLGMVTKDGAKMSKSIGNVVDPGEIIDKFGPDTARFFILFASLPEKELEWSDTGVEACHRFLQRVGSLVEEISYGDGSRREDPYIISRTHSTIRDVTQLIEEMKYNLAIQRIMEYANLLHKYKEKPVNRGVYDQGVQALIKILSPIAPHLCEELWEKTGHDEFISTASWPKYDEKMIDADAEAVQEQLTTLKEDIRKVLELAKIEKPKKITLFLPAGWKYELVKVVKEALGETINPKEVIDKVMAIPELKQHGQNVMKLVPGFLKDRSKLPTQLFAPGEEKEHLASMEPELREIFACKIEIVEAGGAKHPKAEQGMPGKPAILVE